MMLGNNAKPAPRLFLNFHLEDFVPADSILRKINELVDFSWIRKEVADLYCNDNGRPSIDPEVALRLMIAGFFEGIVHDRKLCRRAICDLSIRWFAGLDIDDPIPDHSSFTRLRQRWGEGTFRRVFEMALDECVSRGLVSADTIHVDSTLVRADVSWKSVVKRHVEQVIDENRPDEGKDEKVCVSDPDASLSTSSSVKTPEPAYKHHTVTDSNGIIVASAVTTGNVSEGHLLMDMIDEVEENVGERVETVTADRGYGTAANYANLEEIGVEAVIPPINEKENQNFSFDAWNEIVICKKGQKFGDKRVTAKGLVFRIRSKRCGSCEHRARCFGKKDERTVEIRWGHDSLKRARRMKQNGWSEDYKILYDRHRNVVEGVHGEMKNSHGMRRATRRRLWNVQIQAWLTCAVINLKRLVKAVLGGFLPDYCLYLTLKIAPVELTTLKWRSDGKLAA